MNDAFTPTISVVINTLNRAGHLEDALRALQGLDYPSLEVIVVNGPSTDGTEAVLDRWEGRIKRGRCAQANLAVSRNVGIGMAAGEIIAFIDDDAAPHPRWLAELSEGFRDPRVAGVGGFTIDNTGVCWQVRKTVCDRFGNAFNVSNLFDERPLCRPGSAYYPSLLGTNSAFRAAALRAIGGFDHTFAYLLDETDVCLRLVDAGWRVAYEPAAMVYHQFAPSHIRSGQRVARTLYPSAVSKGYFVMRHGAAQSVTEASAELDRYRSEILAANDWLNRHGRIDDDHRYSLDQDLERGLAHGGEAARKRTASKGDLAPTLAPAPPFLTFEAGTGLRIALVSQGYPPQNEAGIARWTALAAAGLAARGHQVHVITRCDGEESVTFEGGLWLHRLRAEGIGAMALREIFDVPADVADWAARVRRETHHLKSFGLQVLSFPIWDLEGLGVLDDQDLAVVVSLHTTFAMAKPFKTEWTLRPLFEHFVVNRVIAAEKSVLGRAPVLLANSEAIIGAVEMIYGLQVRDRCELVAHGTPDPLITRAARAADRERQAVQGAALRVLFVGRFELRKGFDIAARVAMGLAGMSRGVELWFVGGLLSDSVRDDLTAGGVDLTSAGVRFLGDLDREALDDAYVDCDLLLAPSRFESFGLIGIEAMAARRPVLALAGSGLGEVIEDNVSGRVWPETPDVAERIIAEVLRLDRDRPALLAMGGAARAAYERLFTVARMAEGMERCYRRALAESREAART